MKLENADFRRGEYPHLNVGFNTWVNWMTLDGNKQPFAPYSDLPRYVDENDEPDKFKWSHKENMTDFETAREWGRKHPNLEGVGFIVQRQGDPYKEPADPTVLIDLDDVIAPGGEIHPYAAELTFERAETYADVSVSGTGIHIIGVGELSDDVRTIQDEMPAVDDFPDAEIEVYDGKRFCAMSGKWLRDTPREVNEIGGLLGELEDEFTTTKQTQSGREIGSVNVDNDAFSDRERTDNFDEIADAIDSVKPRDIRLKSTVTRERPGGIIDFDPSFSASESGTRLGWLPDNGVWIYRDGEHYLDALQLVALEERLLTSVDRYPEGETFWKALEALRDRGASIPRYTGNDRDRLGLNKEPAGDDEKAKQFVAGLELM